MGDRRRLSGRRVAIAVGALASVSIALAVVWLVSRDNPIATEPSASPSPSAPSLSPSVLPSSSVAPTPDASPTPSVTTCVPQAAAEPRPATELGTGWESIIIDGRIEDVASSATRVVVVGIDDASAPRAWYSDDGRSFQPAALPEFPVERHLGILRQVAHGPCGWVALGVMSNRAEGIDAIGSIFALSSEDGSEWTDVAVPDECLYPSSVATGTFGYVMSGSRCRSEGDFNRFPIQIWWSPDGLSWNQVPGQPGMSEVGLDTLATNGSRLIGIDGSSPSPNLVWVSDDGRTWSLEEPTRPEEIYTGDVAGSPGGFAAVASRIENGDAIAVGCRSTDGLSWACEDSQPAGEFVDHIVWDGESYVGIWFEADPFDTDIPNDSQAGSSSDGVVWSIVDMNPDALLLYGLKATPFGLYAWGGTQPLGDKRSEDFLLMNSAQPTE